MLQRYSNHPNLSSSVNQRQNEAWIPMDAMQGKRSGQSCQQTENIVGLSLCKLWPATFRNNSRANTEKCKTNCVPDGGDMAQQCEMFCCYLLLTYDEEQSCSSKVRRKCRTAAFSKRRSDMCASVWNDPQNSSSLHLPLERQETSDSQL